MNLPPRCKQFFRRFLLTKIALIIAVCVSLTIFIGAVFLQNKVRQILNLERAASIKHAEIPFKKIPHPPHQKDFVKIWQSASDVRGIAEFKNSVFAATDGGLVEFDENGDVIRHFTVLDGLPESDLTYLIVFQSKLFIGTRTKGLTTFDGERFESFALQNHPTGAITAFFKTARTLLIGTFAGGVLEFDGRGFSEIKNENDKIRFEKITCILQTADRLFIGTFDDGFWVKENGIWAKFTKAEGLPSNRVVGIETAGEQIFIATDLGVARALISNLTELKPFQSNLILPMLSGIAELGGMIFLTKAGGGAFSFPADSRVSKTEDLNKFMWQTPEDFTAARLLKTENQIWLAGNKGVWRMDENFSFKNFGEISDKNQLSNNTISALALDKDERLWVGTFRNGIDIFSTGGKRLNHLETENIREINFLFADSRTNTIRAATSAGVFGFDKSLNFSTLTKTDGLISNSVMHISQNFTEEKPATSAIYYATSRGLMFSENKNLKAITNINGLPSSNSYATLVTRNSLFVGTLNGLAQIENGRVVRVYKDSNSNLKQNWVTALHPANERIFIGTYGGGVFELLSSGEIRSFAEETGKFVVNPNAMHSDGERLFVGTLEGVWVLNLISQKWTNIRDFLPAETVLSIAGNEENIFFGTTGGIAQTNKNYWIDKGL